MTKNEFKKVALIAALAGDSKKASPVRVYDLGGKSTIADFAVLMEVESAPQLDAVEEEVSIRLKQQGVYCLHKEGQKSKNWKVLDYGGVLVHVYEKKAEEFYAIAQHYAGYKPVEWEEKPAAPAAPVKKIVAEAPAAEKPAAAKPAVKKPAAKKPAAKKPAAKKPAPKKPAAKKLAKKAPVKKAALKKPVKKAAARKPVAKKAAAKKTAKKAAVKKPAPKKAAVKKSAAKKAPAKKAAKVKKAKPAAKKVSKKKK
jgi:ribosome silencing factor RsfS/YbeB/iojap